MAKLHLLMSFVCVVSALVPFSLKSRKASSSSFSFDPSSWGGRKGYRCDMPPAINPSWDDLSSADDLFSSKAAFDLQAERLQAVVQVPTFYLDDLGSGDEEDRWRSFDQLHQVFRDRYPILCHKVTSEPKWSVNRFGLVYTVEGSDESLSPVLLTAHQDFVPVQDESDWVLPPFEGRQDRGWLWGRGAAVGKNTLTAIMSAMEQLLYDSEWDPTRTVIMAFGYDKECTGELGAEQISRLLKSRYGENGIAVIIDEGGADMQLHGDTLYALPAVYEKGYLDVWFDLDVLGGSSSVPPPHTGIGILSQVIVALENNPFQPEIEWNSPVHKYFQCLARYSPYAMPDITWRVHRGDLDGLARIVAEGGPEMKYQIQTAQAVNWIGGGQKLRSLPEFITLGVNYCSAPQDSIHTIQHKIAKIVQDVASRYEIDVQAFDDDEEYKRYVKAHDPGFPRRPRTGHKGTLHIKESLTREATPESPTEGAAWNILVGTIRDTFAFRRGNVVTEGSTTTDRTDSVHYLGLSKNIYRWSPRRVGEYQGKRDVNEGIKMTSHMESVKFYYNLVRNFQAESSHRLSPLGEM